MSYGNDRPLPVNPGAGLFRVGERVEWGGSAAGVARVFSGVVVEAVPAGTRPTPKHRVPAGDRREAAGRRDHESYIVKAPNGRRYWPRVSSLSRAPAPITATDHDRELLRQAEEAAGITRPTIGELIERSSLGTPEAKAIRARTPAHVARAIVDRANAMRGGWTGPLEGDWADSSELRLRAPVPPERWPFGLPEAHQSCCILHSGGLYCDCAASDASDDENGIAT